MANKYEYLYVLQGHYGAHGWEDLCAVDKSAPGALREIRRYLRDYRENEGGTYRIVTRRVLRGAA